MIEVWINCWHTKKKKRINFLCMEKEGGTSGPSSQPDPFFFKISFIYSWKTKWERERERGRDTGRGSSRLHAGTPMWDSILGLQDHDLSQRQMLNRATQVPQIIWLLISGLSSDPVLGVEITLKKSLFFFLKIFIYLFIETQRERERGRDTGRGRSRLHVGSLTWDSILSPQDQVPGWKWH